MDTQDRGHAGHEAGFHSAEFGFAVGDVARARMVHRENPTEQPVAFADRHADDLANRWVEPRWRTCRAAVEHQRLSSNAWAQSLDKLFELIPLERALAVRDENWLAVAALGVLAL